MEINVIELFSGIGGFSLGLERAGFNIKKHQFSEIDKYAIANYKYNFKNAEYIGSVTDVRGKRGQADVITFGSPCQDFSLAGKRKGLEGERSSLIGEAIRLVDEVRPRFFIWENVKGAFSSNSGADFWAILQAFTNIGGYRLEWQLLNTKWFLPQNRERIYLIGHLGKGSGRNVFPIGQDIKGFNKGGLSEPTITRTLSAGGKSGGLHSQMTLVRPVLTPDRKEKRQNGRRFKEHGEPAFTLNCQDQHGIMITSNTKKGFEQAKEGDSINLSQPTSKTRRGRVGKSKAQTLETSCNQGVVVGDYRSDEGFRERKDGIAPTLPAQARNDFRNGATILKHHNNQIRRLTEIECERLQGFPDNWTKYGIFEGQEKDISKTQRYKMLGNAVTVDVVEEIGKRLLNHLQ